MEATSSARKRSVWIWLITIYCLFVSILNIHFSLPYFYEDRIMIAEEYYEPSIIDMTINLVMYILVICGTISLFLLRRIALYLFISAFLLATILYLYFALPIGWTQFLKLHLYNRFHAPLFFDYAFYLAVCVYTWKLVRSGTLK